MTWFPQALVAALLVSGCSAGDADTPDPRPTAPRAAVAPGTVEAPANCQDLAPTDLDLIGPPQVVERNLGARICQYDIEPAAFENGAEWPSYFRVRVSVSPSGGVLTYAEVEAVVEEDPAGAASHSGHEVTGTEEIDAAGWTYGFLATSHSVDNPGMYFDNEVARASLELVTDDFTLHCTGELFYPGVTLADSRASVPDLTEYCDTVRDALWES